MSSLLLFHWCCPSIVSSFSPPVRDPRLVEAPGLSVMYEFVSPFLFVVFLGRAFAAGVVQLGRWRTQRSARGEKHTNKDCLLSTRKQPAWVEFLQWKCEFILVLCISPPNPPRPIPKGRWLYLCIRLHLGLYLPSPSFSDVSLGVEIIELCQSKHEIIQKKSPSIIFSCFPLREVTANLNCWQRGDRIAW